VSRRQRERQQQQQQLRYESNFINSIGSISTRRTYEFRFNKYREFASDKLLLSDPRLIENQIIDFIFSLKKRGLRQGSLNGYLSAIIHFYVMNDVVLNRKKITKFINTDERKKRNQNQGYTTEQIQKLLGICDERTKAIILIYVSTGMRLAALPALKIGDLKAIRINDNTGLFQITVYQGYKEEYITFCTPECSKVIDSYLEYRKRSGEELKDDAPLIRERFSIDASDLFRVKNPKHITTDTIAKMLRLKIIQAGRKVDHLVNGKNEGSKYRKDIPLIHGFRKFFNTALMNADVHPSFKKLLMGHSVQLDEVYYDKGSDKSRAKLLEEYSKAIDALTINEEHRLRRKVEMLTVEKSQMDRLQSEVDKIKSLLRSGK
jgi:integrase